MPRWGRHCVDVNADQGLIASARCTMARNTGRAIAGLAEATADSGVNGWARSALLCFVECQLGSPRLRHPSMRLRYVTPASCRAGPLYDCRPLFFHDPAVAAAKRALLAARLDVCAP
jgi:hypothetical protein